MSKEEQRAHSALNSKEFRKRRRERAEKANLCITCGGPLKKRTSRGVKYKTCPECRALVRIRVAKRRMQQAQAAATPVATPDGVPSNQERSLES